MDIFLKEKLFKIRMDIFKSQILKDLIKKYDGDISSANEDLIDYE